MKKRILLALSLAVLLLLVGCSSKTSQRAAVLDAITGFSDVQLGVDDLENQLRGQMRALTGYEERSHYAVDVSLPNFALVDPQSLNYEVPEIDYANADSAAYYEKLLTAMRQSIDGAALMQQADGKVPVQISVSLERVDNTQWLASIDADSVRMMDNLADEMMRQAATTDKLPPEYNYVRVAEQRDTIINSLLDAVGYRDAVTITGVEGLGNNQYRVNLRYPDPEAAFQALGETYVKSFSDWVFGSVVCTLDLNDYSGSNTDISMKSGSITVSLGTDGHCEVTDSATLLSEIDSARIAAQTTAEKQVNDKYGVPELTKPKSSKLLAGPDTGTSGIKITLAKECVDTYVRLFRVDSNSLDEEGTFYAGFFVLADNRTFSLDLPPGNYKVFVAWGKTWYGTEFMFGPNGHYMLIPVVLECKHNYWNCGLDRIDQPWDFYTDMISETYKMPALL